MILFFWYLNRYGCNSFNFMVYEVPKKLSIIILFVSKTWIFMSLQLPENLQLINCDIWCSLLPNLCLFSFFLSFFFFLFHQNMQSMEKLLNLSASALENSNDIMKVAPDIVRSYLLYVFI